MLAGTRGIMVQFGVNIRTYAKMSLNMNKTKVISSSLSIEPILYPHIEPYTFSYAALMTLRVSDDYNVAALASQKKPMLVQHKPLVRALFLYVTLIWGQTVWQTPHHSISKDSESYKTGSSASRQDA